MVNKIKMRIIAKAHINRACKEYPDAARGLESWYKIIADSQFNNFAELKQVFRSADQVGKIVVFNIKGNQYRLIAAVHYNTKIVYVREVMTHAEYDKDEWKSKHKIYD